MQIKTLKQAPKILLYPEVVDKMMLYASKSSDDLFFGGVMQIDKETLYLFDIQLLKQTVDYSKTEIDKELFVGNIRTLEEQDTVGDLSYKILGKCKGVKTCNPTLEEMKYCREIFDNFENAVYISINEKFEINITYLDLEAGVYYEGIDYTIYVAGSSDLTDADIKKEFSDVVTSKKTTYNNTNYNKNSYYPKYQSADKRVKVSELAKTMPPLSKVV